LRGAMLSVGARSVSARSVSGDGTRATFVVPGGTVGSVTLRVSTPVGVATTGPKTYRYL
jgi:hypothetical protein